MVHGWPTLSASVDSVFLFIAGISVLLLAGITGTMVWFAVRYRRSRHPRAENIEGNLALEIVWTVLPTLLVLAIFWVGWKGFVYMRTVPADAMLVKVTGRMWSWGFMYENGRNDTVLRVPADRPVKLAITSADVLHSLFIPAFRVKEDAVPGRETYLWFRPDRTGSFDLFCSEYCGMGHSAMVTKVEVMPAADFLVWYEGKQLPKVPAAKGGRAGLGESLVREKGCIGCHSLDGSKLVGPTFKGLFGKQETVVRAGADAIASVDEAFIRMKILEPEKGRIKGFPPIMPSQKGVLKDDEVEAIIDYLKTLK